MDIPPSMASTLLWNLSFSHLAHHRIFLQPYFSLVHLGKETLLPFPLPSWCPCYVTLVDVLVVAGGYFPPRLPFLDAEKIPEARDPLNIY
jgi:hypothetical protein